MKGKSKKGVPGLDDNQSFRDGHALLREDGHPASDSTKHRKRAWEHLEEADQLGANNAAGSSCNLNMARLG